MDESGSKPIEEKWLCFKCVTEDYLSGKIRKKGKRARCDYCGKSRRSFLLDEIADQVESAFAVHYYRTSNYPDSYQEMKLRHCESSYEFDRDGETTTDAIINATGVAEDVASDLQIILSDRYFDFDSAAMGEEVEFSADAQYAIKSANHSELSQSWDKFERSLSIEARFFNQSAVKHLKSLFEGADALTTYSGRPTIVSAGPDTQLKSLFRARVFQSDDELETALTKPDRHLGSPPPRLAAAGRMNARGISVFYGAESQTVALAEVRPPVGSQVAIARFDIVRPLRLLDLIAFDEVVAKGSIFDPEFIRVSEKASFLRTLGQRLSRPVMPNDEALAYLATQAVADFLATEPKLNLDGLIFPAVQAAGGGRNVVLFHKAARVRMLDIADGTKIAVNLWSQDEDRFYRDYSVIEEVPSVEMPADEINAGFVRNSRARRREQIIRGQTGWADWLNDTLQIIQTEIEVHVINAVHFETERHHVNWYRWKHNDDVEF